MDHPTVSILGAGSLGAIIARGLLRAGWSTDAISLVVRRTERADELERETGIKAGTDLVEGARDSRLVIVAVKPKDVATVLQQVAGALTSDQVVVSLAAGVELLAIGEILGDQPVVRAMPNTPAAVDQGMTVLAPGPTATPEHLALVRTVFESVGVTMELSEDLFDAVTAVSGTGPAYVFLLAEALIEAAIREGLPHHAAERLVHQTLRGSGDLLALSDKSAFRLRGQVTSPGGTTAAAVHVLENGGFRALLEDAVQAAADRSRQLGDKAAGR
ncbi:MAG: pyrroline-5-carboxylate reductase [Acidimicrobiia bacterium]|nr:pyrroline-5-carboxylate reductase [Acidimicrobiia bacterium]